MPQFQVRVEREPFQQNTPLLLVVEAEDEADAYLTAYDYLTKRGDTPNTTGVYDHPQTVPSVRWLKPEVKQKISESGLPCQGYPAITHITEITQFPRPVPRTTSYGKGKVING